LYDDVSIIILTEWYTDCQCCKSDRITDCMHLLWHRRKNVKAECLCIW